MKKTLRVAVYLRANDAQAASLAGQRAALGKHARKHGLEIVQEFVDRGSGGAARRPGLERLTETASAGAFEGVLVVGIDRLARSLHELIRLTQELRAAGVRILSLDGDVDSATPLGRMMLAILGLFAEYERDAIRTRRQRKK